MRGNDQVQTLSIWLIVFFLMPISLFGQSTPVEFGQNRVQYREFRWQIYPTDNF